MGSFVSNEEYWMKLEFSRRKKFHAITKKEFKEKRRPISQNRAHSNATPIAMKNLKSLLITLPDVNIIFLMLIMLIMTTSLYCNSSPSLVTPDSDHHHQQQQLDLSLVKQARFAEPEEGENMQTVAVGRPVKFKCVVNDIGDHKLAWFHKDRRLLLAIDNKTVAWRERIHVSSHANSVFFLQIDSVQLNDKGQITCQLNTQPVRSQVHILDIVKSPQIREQETTLNIEPVKEFSPAELRCVADGIPKPLIKWRRESQMHVLPVFDEDDDQALASDGSEDSNNQRQEHEFKQQQHMADGISSKEALQMAQQSVVNENFVVKSEINNSNKKGQNQVSSAPSLSQSEEPTTNNNTVTTTSMKSSNKFFIGEGEVLRFDRVSRYDMGFYMCIASNGVSPSVSQRIFLPVSFVPKKTEINSSLAPVSGTTTLRSDDGKLEAKVNNSSHNIGRENASAEGKGGSSLHSSTSRAQIETPAPGRSQAERRQRWPQRQQQQHRLHHQEQHQKDVRQQQQQQQQQYYNQQQNRIFGKVTSAATTSTILITTNYFYGVVYLVLYQLLLLLVLLLFLL